MFTAYLEWWDRHPWVAAAVLGVAALVLAWQAYSDVRRRKRR